MIHNFENEVKDLLSSTQESNLLLYEILNNSPMAVNIIREDGVCIFENDAMKNALEDFDGKALGTNVFSLSSFKEYGLRDYYDRCFQGEKIKLENYRFVSSLTGKEILSDIMLMPINVEGKKAVITFYFDSLKHVKKLFEDKIRNLENERDFSFALLNQAPIAIYAFDKEGNIFNANQAANKSLKNFLDDTKAELKGKNVFELEPFIPHKLVEKLKRAIKGIPYVGEMPVTESNEENNLVFDIVITPIYDDEEVRSILVMYSDVTEQARIRRSMKDDMSLARKIQSTIISDDYKDLIEELEIFVHYQPMSDVGGDFYDINKLMPGNKIRIFITDATGHGVQGALTTMLIKGEYEKVKIFDLPPNKVLDIVNNNFVSLYPNLNIFFTCFIADIDLNENIVRYSSAGHPEQLLLRDDKIFSLSCKGRYLGIFEKADYKLMEMQIEKGDRLFLFTDGLFEEFSEDNEIFGQENLVEVVRKNRNNVLKKHAHSVVTDVFGFKGWNSLNDDITFIAVEIL